MYAVVGMDVGIDIRAMRDVVDSRASYVSGLCTRITVDSWHAKMVCTSSVRRGHGFVVLDVVE